jgi:hypothetical protein
MRIAMRFEELNEAATDVLFHATSISAAASILKNKKIKLTSAMGTGSERSFQKNDRFYYLSTARSKVADYTLHNIYSDGVVLNLNGRWFSQRYKSSAVDYWEGYWQKQRAAGVEDRYSEMEDRIFSREPNIDLPANISDAISEIHVLIKDRNIDERRVIFLRNLLIEAKRNNVPIFIYDDKKSMILQDKRKTIPLKEIIPLLKKEPEKSWRSMKPRDYLKSYRELYFKNAEKDLSKDAKRILSNIKYYDYSGDVLRSLEADLHNAKSSEAHQESLNRTLKIFRKEKLKTPKEFLDFLKAKWIKD